MRKTALHKAWVRWGRVCRVGKEAGAGGVEVASIGTGQVKAEKLNRALSWSAGVVGGAHTSGGRRWGGRRRQRQVRGQAEQGASGTDNKGLSVCGVVAVGVGVKGWAGVVCRGAEEETVGKRAKLSEI
jgi:hypothetical protein